jgi:hypothetical protein
MQAPAPAGTQLQPQSRLNDEGIIMKVFFIAPLLIAISGMAMAGPTCNAAKDKWMSEGDFKKGVEARGYTIKTFKVSKGQCYEIYGTDKAGKKVEIYFDPVNGAVLESK